VIVLASSDLRPLLLSGPLMVLLALLSVVAWRRLSGTRWKWFCFGAAVWAVAVALKIGWSMALHEPVLRALKGLSPTAYLILGGLYIGVVSAAFEMGITLAAARRWPEMTVEPGRGVAVAVGAGAFEALLIGLSVFAAVLIALVGGDKTAGGRETLVASAAITPLSSLVGPAERVIAILCHVSSRALILMGAAKKRTALIVLGFVLFAGLDGVAGGFHISGRLGRMSLWWVELALLPFAVISIPIIVWCVRSWPKGVGTEQSPPAAES